MKTHFEQISGNFHHMAEHGQEEVFVGSIGWPDSGDLQSRKNDRYRILKGHITREWIFCCLPCLLFVLSHYCRIWCLKSNFFAGQKNPHDFFQSSLVPLFFIYLPSQTTPTGAVLSRGMNGPTPPTGGCPPSVCNKIVKEDRLNPPPI